MENHDAFLEERMVVVEFQIRQRIVSSSTLRRHCPNAELHFGTTISKSSPAKPSKCDSLKVTKVWARACRADAAMSASYIRPPEIPVPDAESSSDRYAEAVSAIVFTFFTKLA